MYEGVITASVVIKGVISAGQGDGNIQDSKTVVPTDEQQMVFPDEGYDGIAVVVCEGIPNTYGHIAYNGSSLRVY